MSDIRNESRVSDEELARLEIVLERLLFERYERYPYDYRIFERIYSKLSEIDSRINRLEECCSSNSSSMELLVNRSSWQSGQGAAGRTLNSFVAESGELIVIDPYFLSPHGRPQEDLKKIYEALDIQNAKLRHIHIIHEKGANDIIKQGLEEKLKELSIGYSYSQTDIIHDRIWISDRSSALLVGHSLGGVGGDKLTFIVDLPEKDLHGLIVFLNANKLLPPKRGRSARSKKRN